MLRTPLKASQLGQSHGMRQTLRKGMTWMSLSMGTGLLQEPQHKLSTSPVDSRDRHASAAADNVREPGSKANTHAQHHTAGHQDDTEQAPASGPGQSRQLGRLDSKTGSSPSAKKPAMLLQRSPQRRLLLPDQKMKGRDSEPPAPRPGQALNRDLSTSVNSRQMPSHVAAATRGPDQKTSGHLAQPSRHMGTGNGRPVGHSCEPPRFSQTKPAVGKSRMAGGSSQQGKGESVRSGAASGDFGSKHHGKGSGSVKPAGMDETQDNAAASEGNMLQKRVINR